MFDMFDRRLRSLSFLFVAMLAVVASPLDALAQKCLAPGFKVELLYSVPEIEHPSVVACDNDGNLFVGEDPMDMRGPTTKEFDRVLKIQFGPDGKPVRKTVFCDKLAAVFGLIWHDGALYVMHAPHYSVFRDTDGDGVADERKDLASGFGPPAGVYGFNDHIVTGTRLGLDGRVYVSVGDKGVPKAVGADGSTITLEGGGVIRMKLDGTQLEVVTSGTRNHLDVAMDSLDNIFTYDNTDDGLGWWTRFTHHVPTGYYGYPYDYHPHPERHLPRISEHGGGSPVGAACYREAAWPATYVDSPFFCEWGKAKVQRFKLTRDGASFKAEIEDFLVPDGSPEPFRPLDLCFSPDGRHMYLADWNFNGWVNPAVKGRLFRITYVGDEPAVKTEPPRAPKNASTAELLASLGHPSHAERLRAELAIAGRGAEAVRAATTLLASPAFSPRAKVHAIWAAQLHASKVTPDAAAATGERVRPVDAWIAALADADATVRAQAARALGTERAKEKEAIDALGKVVRGDRDATVRMQAAIALGRIGDAQPDAQWTSTDSGQAGAIVPRLDDKHLAPQKAGDARVAAPLWEALVDPDQYARHVVVQALRTINNWQDAPTYLARPDTRPGALLALTGVYDEEAARALRDFALKGTPDGGRAAAVAALTEVHRRAAPYEKGWWGTQPARGKPVRAKNQDWSGTSTVLGTLRDVLDNPGPLAAKLAVVQAWRTIPDPAALPQLRKIAAQRDGGELASEAVKSLAAMKDRESVGLLASIAGDAQAPEALRREALRGITAIGSPEAVKQLQEIVASGASTPVIVQAALEALGTLKIADAAPAVAARLADSTPAVRISAATSLAQILGDKAAMRLTDLLKDRDVTVRRAAVGVLGGFKSRELTPALVAAAADPELRFDAQLAVAAAPDRRALTLYLDGLTSANADLRGASLNALVSIRSSIEADILELAKQNELPAKVRGPLQGVFSAPAPVTTWQMIGSFPKAPADQLPKFDFAAAPDLNQLHHVGTRAVKWKRVETKDAAGRINPGQHLDGPKEGVWSYAYAAIEAEADGPRTLVVGSDDQLFVWVNGKKAYEFTGNRGWDREQGKLTAEFRKGTNHVWMKCGNDGGPWDMSAAISVRDPRFAFLYENVPPTLDIGAFRDFAAKNAGDVGRGKSIFNNQQGVGCVKCHAVGGTGGKVGPDLVGIASRYQRDELVRSILEPSARIANGYDTATVVTNDGKTVTGVLKLDSPEAVELMLADGKLVRIAASDIDEKNRSPISLMPNGLKDGLTLEAFADLVAYLESLKEPAK